MNALKVQRYYELKQQMKELETEAKILNEEIKDEMLKKNIKEAVVGKYVLQLHCQDRSEMDEGIIPYLKACGHEEIIVETYDHDKLKELEKKGALDEGELAKYRIQKLIHSLSVKLC